MAPLQRVSGFLMALDGIQRWSESLHGMAFDALAPRFSPGELPSVIIGVAVHTTTELQTGQGLPFFMAFFAGQRGVSAFQRIPRFSMIEFCPVYIFPARGIMAGSALLIELPAMYILMTIGTLGVFDPGEFYIYMIW
jgi:hypothetical protein